MKYGWSDAQKLVRREFQIQSALSRNTDGALNIPILMGPTGIGKSALGAVESEYHGLDLVVVNVGDLSDPSDHGCPVPIKVGDKKYVLNWALNEQILQVCERPCILVFDDLQAARREVQGMFLAIAGTRTFRDVPIHSGTLIMACANDIGQDMYANQLSEPLRTRMTVINMEARLADFIEYGRRPYGTREGEQAVEEDFLGYLTFKPEHLHKQEENVARFPTPRGWWEASRHTAAFPNPDEDVLGTGRPNWKITVGLKLGEHVADDFWSWHTILRRIDEQALLLRGALPRPADDENPMMMQYAAVYLVARALIKQVDPAYTGLPVFVEKLTDEMKVSLLMHLSSDTRGELAKVMPAVSAKLMEALVGA